MFSTPICSIILAAGRGSRMHTDLPKVLHTLAGKPLLEYVLATAKTLSHKTYVVCGYGQQHLHNYCKNWAINWVKQTQQLGTAHAVSCALQHIDKCMVLILYGDVPFINASTLNALIKKASHSGVCLLSAIVDDPSGYGRIIRDKQGNIQKIIEQKEADKKTLKNQEINSGTMAIHSDLLHQYLPQINNHNRQNEYYLTDIIGLLSQDNIKVSNVFCQNKIEIMGVNDKAQLGYLERAHQQRLVQDFTQAGLQLLDPKRFDCRGSLSFGRDCQIDINVIIKGKVKLGHHVIIEANCILDNVVIGDDCHIYPNSILEDCQLAKAVQVGPFARIRPQTKLAQNSKIGNFVEIKKSTIGQNSKVNHLSYIGDSTLGAAVNVGAGVITCNYDGYNKHQTHIKDDAFIGSNSALVAPLKIGKNATIGAGSTITENAPDNKLTLNRPQQQISKNWQRPSEKTKNQQTKNKKLSDKR